MSAAGTILFVVCGLLGLISALATIMARSPIRAAVALLVHIVALAGLFLTLHAHLLAILQLIIYAGAVVVLFVFAIMFIGPIPASNGPPRLAISGAFSLAAMALLAIVLSFLLAGYNPPYEIIAGCPSGSGAECGQFGGVAAFSGYLFRQATAPFELVSALLTVAVVGAIMVARGHSTPAAQASDAEARKLSEPDSGGGD